MDTSAKVLELTRWRREVVIISEYLFVIRNIGNYGNGFDSDRLYR